MNKIIYIALFSAAALLSNAQVKSTEADSSASGEWPVDIISRIELKSVLGADPLFTGGRIYTAERSGIISCYDTSGTIRWKRQMTAEIFSGPVIADGQLAAGLSNGDITSLISFTGVPIQSIGIDDSITTDLGTIEYKGDKELFLPKQSTSGTAIIFGTKSGSIYCMDLETLQEYWRNNDSRGSIASRPVIEENKILFSGSDGFLYSIDSRNGLLNWRWKETAETDFSRSQIFCDGKKIFLVSADNNLYCIDLLLGKLIWKIDKIKILPAIALSENLKGLYAKTLDNRFFLISAEKGSVLRQLKHDAGFDSTRISPVESEGKIFFTGGNSIFSVNSKFKEEVIMNFGEESISSLKLIDKNKFIVSTSAGTVLIFKPRD